MSTAFSIPYQLRPHKAIERNIFLSLLKRIDRSPLVEISKYRYIGFGAPFLEEYKILHLELGLKKMDCIEYHSFPFSRQVFNNPYRFIKLYNTTSTEFIGEGCIDEKENHIIWWDFASPGQLRQQLRDCEATALNLNNLDILKITFNSQESSFTSSHGKGRGGEPKKILEILKEDEVFQQYLPDKLSIKEVLDDFSSVIRAMAIRAIRRGLLDSGKNLTFKHICSFQYRDGQQMTTMTGIICKPELFDELKKGCGLNSWDFYVSEKEEDEYIKATPILVPAMTIKERIEIDRKIPNKSIEKLVPKLSFYYGSDENENRDLLSGYCKFYKFLPYYSKVFY